MYVTIGRVYLWDMRVVYVLFYWDNIHIGFIPMVASGDNREIIGGYRTVT